MKETMRKLLAYMLSFMMLFSSLPTNALAEGISMLMPDEADQVADVSSTDDGPVVDVSSPFNYSNVAPYAAGWNGVDFDNQTIYVYIWTNSVEHALNELMLDTIDWERLGGHIGKENHWMTLGIIHKDKFRLPTYDGMTFVKDKDNNTPSEWDKHDYNIPGVSYVELAQNHMIKRDPAVDEFFKRGLFPYVQWNIPGAYSYGLYRSGNSGTATGFRYTDNGYDKIKPEAMAAANAHNSGLKERNPGGKEDAAAAWHLDGYLNMPSVEYRVHYVWVGNDGLMGTDDDEHITQYIPNGIKTLTEYPADQPNYSGKTIAGKKLLYNLDGVISNAPSVTETAADLTELGYVHVEADPAQKTFSVPGFSVSDIHGKGEVDIKKTSDIYFYYDYGKYTVEHYVSDLDEKYGDPTPNVTKDGNYLGYVKVDAATETKSRTSNTMTYQDVHNLYNTNQTFPNNLTFSDQHIDSPNANGSNGANPGTYSKFEYARGGKIGDEKNPNYTPNEEFLKNEGKGTSGTSGTKVVAVGDVIKVYWDRILEFQVESDNRNVKADNPASNEKKANNIRQSKIEYNTHYVLWDELFGGGDNKTNLIVKDAWQRVNAIDMEFTNNKNNGYIFHSARAPQVTGVTVDQNADKQSVAIHEQTSKTKNGKTVRVPEVMEISDTFITIDNIKGGSNDTWLYLVPIIKVKYFVDGTEVTGTLAAASLGFDQQKRYTLNYDPQLPPEGNGYYNARNDSIGDGKTYEYTLRTVAVDQQLKNVLANANIMSATDEFMETDWYYRPYENATDVQPRNAGTEAFTYTLMNSNAANAAHYHEDGVLVVELHLHTKKPSWTVAKSAKVDGAEVGKDVGVKVDVGDTITYTITVTNTGNTELNLDMSDVFTGNNGDVGQVTQKVYDKNGQEVANKAAGPMDFGTFTDHAFTLDVGEYATFTYTYTVDVRDSGELKNVVVADDSRYCDPDDPDKNKDHDKHKADKTIEVNEKPAFTVTKSVADAADATGKNVNRPFSALEGETLTYTIKIKNTGNVTLDGLTLADVFKATLGNNTERADAAPAYNWTSWTSSMDPSAVTVTGNGNTAVISGLGKGEELTFTYTYTVQAGDRVLDNTVTVTPDKVKYPDLDEEEADTETPIAHIKVEKNVSADTKVPKTGWKAGNEIYFTITVRNDGEVTLYDIKVDDKVLAPEGKSAEILESNSSAYTVDKTLNQATIAKLEKGESVEIRVKYIVSKDHEIVQNHAEATGTTEDPDDKDDPDPDKHNPKKVEDDDDVTTLDQNWLVTKTTYLWDESTSKWVEIDDNYVLEPGDKIQYAIVVENLGNSDLKGLRLTDIFTAEGELENWTGDPDKTFDLKPTEKKQFTAEYTVQETDDNLHNVAIVDLPNDPVNDPEPTGDPEKDGEEWPKDERDNKVKKHPMWEIEKSAKVGGQEVGKDKNVKVKVGDTITYTVTVKNTGNTPLKLKLEDVFERNDITVPMDQFSYELVRTTKDGKTQPGEVLAAPYTFDLAKGETVEIVYTYKVRPDDAELENTAMVDDPENPCDDPDPDDDPDDPAHGHHRKHHRKKEIEVVAKPAYTLEKTVEDQNGINSDILSGGYPAKAGDTLTYKIVVSNVGNAVIPELTLDDVFDGVFGNITVTVLPETDQVTQVTQTSKEDSVVAYTIKSFAKGSTVEFTYEYSVTDDEELTVIENEVKATPDTNPDHYPDDADLEELKPETKKTETPIVHLTVEKTVTSYPKNGGWEEGDTVAFEIKITNDGGAALYNIALEDLVEGETSNETQVKLKKLHGPYDVNAERGENDPGENLTANNTYTIPVLEAGKYYIVTVEYTVTSSGLSDGKVTNTARATGHTKPDLSDPDDGDKTVDDEDDVTTEFSAWEVVKKAYKLFANGTRVELTDDNRVCAGDTIVYVITVTNKGDLKLEGLTLTDAFTTDVERTTNGELTWVGVDPTADGYTFTLEKAGEDGDQVSFEATYVVQQDDDVLHNVVTVTDPDDPDNPEESETDNKVSKYTVKKDLYVGDKLIPDGGTVYEGQTVTYVITVTNTGAVALDGLKLSDVFTITPKDLQAALEWIDVDPTADGYSFDLAAPQEEGYQRIFKATYDVDEDDLHLNNVVTVTDPKVPDDPDDPDDDPKTDETDHDISRYTVKKVAKINGVEITDETAVYENQTVEYVITVTNTGNVDLEGLTLTDEFVVTGEDKAVLTWTSDDPTAAGYTFNLKAGKSIEFTAEYTVGKEGTHLHNKVTVDNPNDPDDPNDPPSDKTENKVSRYTVKKVAKINGAEITDATAVYENQTVEYVITVTNTGEVDLEGLTLTDEFVVTELDGAKLTWKGTDPTKAGYTFDLPVGGHIDFIAEYKVGKDGVHLHNEVKVEDPNVPTDPDDPDEPIVPPPSDKTDNDISRYTVEKSAYVGDTKLIDGVTAVYENQTVKYVITVTNTGEVDLVDLKLTDEFIVAELGNAELTWTSDDPTGDDYTFNLAVGKSIEFTAEYTVGKDGIHLYNKVTVEDPNVPEDPENPGEPIVPPPTDDTDSPIARYESDKSIDDDESDKPNADGKFSVGQKVVFNITVKNTGDATLENVTVSEKLNGAMIQPDKSVPAKYTVSNNVATILTIMPDEVVTVKVEYVVKQADIDNEGVTNVAVVKDPGDPNDPQEPEEEVETEDPNPVLDIVKEKANEPENGEGFALYETIVYSITVTNIGNVTLTNVKVVDDLTGAEWLPESWTDEADGTWRGGDDATPGTLEVGETAVFTTSHVVTEDDILNGSVLNVATATGNGPHPGESKDPDPVDDDETVDTEDPNPHLTLTKETVSKPKNGTAYVPGEVITYQITVLNDGNLTIFDLVVNDELTKDVWKAEHWLKDNVKGTWRNGEDATPGTLEPGETVVFSATYIVNEADGRRGKVHNVAVGEGSSRDPENPTVPTNPGEVDDPTTSVTPVTINVKGTKVWVDYGNSRGLRPDSIDVTLYANGEPVDAIPTWTKNGDNWTFIFYDMPYADEDGTPITYTVSEAPVDEYTTSYDGMTITNTLKPQYTSIAGHKTWKDNDDAAGLRPESITVRLMRDGVVIDEKVVTEADGWNYSFSNLPMSDPDTGVDYVYTIGEASVSGYYAITNGNDLVNVLMPTLEEKSEGFAQLHPTDEELEKMIRLFEYDIPLWGDLLKTGLETPVYPFVFAGIGALALVMLAVLNRRKRKMQG